MARQPKHIDLPALPLAEALEAQITALEAHITYLDARTALRVAERARERAIVVMTEHAAEVAKLGLYFDLVDRHLESSDSEAVETAIAGIRRVLVFEAKRVVRQSA